MILGTPSFLTLCNYVTRKIPAELYDTTLSFYEHGIRVITLSSFFLLLIQFGFDVNYFKSEGRQIQTFRKIKNTSVLFDLVKSFLLITLFEF